MTSPGAPCVSRALHTASRPAPAAAGSWPRAAGPEGLCLPHLTGCPGWLMPLLREPPPWSPARPSLGRSVPVRWALLGARTLSYPGRRRGEGRGCGSASSICLFTRETRTFLATAPSRTPLRFISQKRTPSLGAWGREHHVPAWLQYNREPARLPVRRRRDQRRSWPHVDHTCGGV